MKKNLLVSVFCVFILLSLSLLPGKAQDIYIIDQNFTGANAIQSCSAIIKASGGNSNNYSNNENYTFTVCPDSPNNQIVFVFNTFSLSTIDTAPGSFNNSDQVYVYDGIDNNPINSNSLGNYGGTGLQGVIIQPTPQNETGCLTFQFISNDQGVGQFSALISCANAYNCPGDLVITNEYNQVNLGETAYFNASTSLDNPSFTWQSDLGLGFQNLENYGKYSGVYTDQLQISNVQLSEHQQIFRVIAESGNCADTSNISLLSLTDTSFNTCEDTIINYITIYDTLTTYVSVTDTLIIETIISDINSIEYSNTITVYPNPTHSILNIDYGAFEVMSNCQLRIVNSIGAVIYETEINQQYDSLDLSQWGGSGSYILTILDPNGNIINTKQIIIE